MSELYTADQELRVLSLWQPWASLMAWGEKRNETRSSKWNFAGWVAIHASARNPLLALNDNDYFREALHAHSARPLIDSLPCGQILAVVRFSHHVSTDDANLFDFEVSDKERAFGDYGNGRYYYPTTDLAALRNPLHWKGGQGLRIAPLELRERIAEALKGDL